MAVRVKRQTPEQERAAYKAALRSDLRKYRAAAKERADRGLHPLPAIEQTIAETEEALSAA